jgi:hypothetical protein
MGGRRPAETPTAAWRKSSSATGNGLTNAEILPIARHATKWVVGVSASRTGERHDAPGAPQGAPRGVRVGAARGGGLPLSLPPVRTSHIGRACVKSTGGFERRRRSRSASGPAGPDVPSAPVRTAFAETLGRVRHNRRRAGLEPSGRPRPGRAGPVLGHQPSAICRRPVCAVGAPTGTSRARFGVRRRTPCFFRMSPSTSPTS